jgi:phage protein D
MSENTTSARPTIEIDGQPMPPELDPVLELSLVDQDVLLADSFSLTFRDLDRKLFEKARLKIGSTIRISGTELGGTRPTLLMTGEVTALEADYHPGGSRATVRGYDQSHRLSRGRRSDTYRNMKDSDIAQQLAKKSSLKIGTIDDSGTVHDHVSQANQSDWEFLSARARKIGFEVVVIDGSFHFRKLKQASTAPGEGDYSNRDPLALVFGQNLLSFRPRITASGQVPEIQVRGWDPGTKKPLVASAKAGTVSADLKSKPGDLATAFAAPMQVSVNQPVATADEAQRVASALAEHIGSAFAEADGVARGNPKLAAGTPISVSVVADHFEGRYTLTHTRHVFDSQGYRTEFVVSGRQQRSLLGLATMGAKSGGGGSGDSSTIPGVAPAIVTNVTDPAKLGRVQVKFPWLNDSYETFWARMCQFGAGPNSGAVYLPDVGDEVLVAFEQGHISHPFIIGGLHNGVDKPPVDDKLLDNGKVTKRLIVSRAGHRFTFFEGAQESGVQVQTAGGLVVNLDDKASMITITGDHVTIEGKHSLKLKSGGEGELNAGSTLTIKGSTVNIN